MNLYHGIDLVDINRREFKNKKLFHKVLHPKEIDAYLSLEKKHQVKFLASRWAIKEALFKALPQKRTMNNIYIEYKNNQPIFLLNRHLVQISLTYEKNWVLASVIIIKQ